MSAVERRFLLWCSILYALPVAGVLLPQGVVQLMVPRDLVSRFVVFHFNAGFPAIGADSYGNMYKVAIAATLVIVSVLASLAYCLHWIFTTGRKLVGPTLEKLLLRALQPLPRSRHWLCSFRARSTISRPSICLSQRAFWHSNRRLISTGTDESSDP
jgi:hypothetical protein